MLYFFMEKATAFLLKKHFSTQFLFKKYNDFQKVHFFIRTRGSKKHNLGKTKA